MVLTVVLSTGSAQVASGVSACIALIDKVLNIDHSRSETTMSVGDTEFRTTKNGPIPNHQLRISVDVVSGFAAINYMDHDDPIMPIANSYNPEQPSPDVSLIFNGHTGSVFPRESAVCISRARSALIEWLGTRRRPICIEWRPYDDY